ncbi:MAG: hypothetical protein QOF48_3854 [Verrucomicrobiota bacterium]
MVHLLICFVRNSRLSLPKLLNFYCELDLTYGATTGLNGSLGQITLY